MFDTFPQWLQIWARLQFGAGCERNIYVLTNMALVEIHEMRRQATMSLYLHLGPPPLHTYRIEP